MFRNSVLLKLIILMVFVSCNEQDEEFYRSVGFTNTDIDLDESFIDSPSEGEADEDVAVDNPESDREIPKTHEDFGDWVKDTARTKKYICDPFHEKNEDMRVSRQGIAASLYDGLNQKIHNFSDYLEKGVKIDAPIFLNDINVPTRPFDRGFELPSGAKVSNANGDKLFEYFALDVKGNIRLRDNQEAGFYQFALLSDDGSILHLNIGGERKLIVDNDRKTPTRMACASKGVYIEKGQEIPFDLGYFQAPRMHIALMLLWRKVDSESQLPYEPHCKKSGNSYFFNSKHNPPTPSSNYNDLLNNGWEVLKPGNYTLPGTIAYNPCEEGASGNEKDCYEEEIPSSSSEGRIELAFDGLESSTISLKSGDKVIDVNYNSEQGIVTYDSSAVESDSLKLTYCILKNIY